MRFDEADREVYRRYAELALPRHTSYPAVPFWRPYGERELDVAIERSNRRGRDLSLYVHVPFCERLCYYCSCTKEIVPRKKNGRSAAVSSTYLNRLQTELSKVASSLDDRRIVRQIHLGGGTPTYLNTEQLVELTGTIHRHFQVAQDAEASVELDPRVTSHEQLSDLRTEGFNRVSLGVQDFNTRVQHAVNRVQPIELVAELVDSCRKLGFQSINFDLIYGLPFQTVESMTETVRQAISLGPDRVAFYRMAVIPELFRCQNVFSPEDLPPSDATCDMFLNALDAFTEAGYRFIGLDHFAKPQEALAKAQEQVTLRRSFQGMTTGAGLDLFGFGPSAISVLYDAYAQNLKGMSEWSAAIDAGRLAISRGMDLSREDLIRQAVIEQLYCQAEIDKASLDTCFDIHFDEYFADELSRLAELEQDGIVQEYRGPRIRVTVPLGRMLLRVVAAVFDAYLPRDAFQKGQVAMLASKVG